MTDDLRANLETRKTLLELQITALDQQATILALQSTLLEVGSVAVVEAFEKRRAAEQRKRLAERDSFQIAAQTIQTIIDKYPRPTGPVH